MAYSFRQMFVAPIRAGLKAQTTRAERKRHARPGEILQLYTGMRTRHCQAIGTATCAAIIPIRIEVGEAIIGFASGLNLTMIAELNDFAVLDGFDGWLAMRAFWIENHPKVSVFSGVLIRWIDFRSADWRPTDVPGALP